MNIEIPFIIFETTTLCNLNCLYCYNIWKIPGTEKQNLNSYKQAHKTLKKLFKISDVKSVTFTGGEPLVAERISELVLFCRMKKAGVTIISNGNAGKYEDYKTLISLGAGLFEFPLHSHNSEIHDYLTRKAGSHSKVVQSVQDVISLNGDVVIDIVLTKINSQELRKTLKFIKSLGIDRVMLTRFNVGGEGISNRHELLPDIVLLKNTFKIADDASDEFDMSITSNVCTPLCIINPDDYKNILTTSCSANINNMPLTLDILGNMRICNHSPVNIGNIYKNSLEEIFNAEYVKSWREIVPEYCSDCYLYSSCFGGCRAASEQLGLGLNHPDPVLEISKSKVS
jgi:radical SAM protein with 4Fe4S-binding SPASM domain